MMTQEVNNKIHGYKAPDRPNDDEIFTMKVLGMEAGDWVEFRDGGFVVYRKDEVKEIKTP